MKFFKRRKQISDSPSADKAAGWIASGISKVQHFWAKGMNRCFNRLHPRLKKTVLLGACLLMVAYSSVLIAHSFTKATITFVKPTAAVQPLSIIKPANPMPVGVPAYIRRIERFKDYLDSLSHTPDGRRIRDSILERRPGLLDSIQRIETIYCKR